MPAESSSAALLDIQQIMGLLPHRYPFLLIDRVVEAEPRQRIVAIKNVSANEPQFQGHFPGFPLMPGVLIIEAMAQAGGALLLSEYPDRDQKLMLFTGIDGAKFRRPVTPGDQLRIEVKVLNWRSRAVKMHGVATVDGKVACEATVMCQLVPRQGAAGGGSSAASSGSHEAATAAEVNGNGAAAVSTAKDTELQAASASLAGEACQPNPMTESHALPEAAV